MIAHIVFFEPKASVDADAIRSVAQKMAELKAQVGVVRRGYIGKSASVDAGYTRNFGDKTYRYAAVLEFDDQAGLISYLRHPLHAEVGRLFWDFCERTAIVEVEAKAVDDPELGDFLVG